MTGVNLQDSDVSRTINWCKRVKFSHVHAQRCNILTGVNMRIFNTSYQVFCYRACQLRYVLASPPTLPIMIVVMTLNTLDCSEELVFVNC